MWYETFLNFRKGSTFWGEHGEMAFLLGIIAVVYTSYYVFTAHKEKRLPPGPIGLPIFGYYFFLGKKPELTLLQLTKKYGNVVGLYLGRQYVVFLNDWEAMKEGLSQKATVDRPPIFDKIPYSFGVNGISGEEWIESRRLSSRAMKDIGLNNTVWEQLVQEEVSDLVEQIIHQGDRPLEVRSFFNDTFANNMVTVILGKRLPTGHPFTKTVAKSADAVLDSLTLFSLSNYSPILSKILQGLGLEEKGPSLEVVNEFSQFISETVDSVIKNPNSENEDSFVVRFQEQIENHRKTKEKTCIKDDNIKGTVLALLLDGSETGRNTTIWTLMALAENQDIQNKIHEELDRVIGKDGSIRWPDRFKIPYTFATLLESMRWATVVPLTTLRLVTEDIQIQGYHIPKGTFLTANTYSIHNDPRYWKEPRQFRPERFLTEDGKVNSAPDSYSPFSYGKRNCLGKLMALMEILQYLCILMQNFKVLPKEGNKVKHGVFLGITYQATGVELRFIPRK